MDELRHFSYPMHQCSQGTFDKFLISLGVALHAVHYTIWKTVLIDSSMAILFPSYAHSFVFHSILKNSIAKHVQQLFLKWLEHPLAQQHFTHALSTAKEV